MDKTAFTLLGFPIYWYGLLFAGGFIAATLLMNRLGRGRGKAADLGSDIAVVIMIGTLVGARTAYILSEWDYFAANPGKILAFREGGMVFYGGVVMSLALLVGFALKRREHPLDLLDLVATAVPLGHAFGRMGCFLNSCCGGVPAAWGLADAEGVRRVPVQLFETAGNLVICAVLVTLYRRHPPRGRVTALYFLLYPALRFANEFFRGDDRLQVAGGLNAAQTTSLVLMAGATAVWFAAGRRRDKPA